MTELLLAGTIEDYAARGYLIVKVNRREICVVSDGVQFYALANSCSHMGSQIHRGDIANGIIVCPWHRARFELATGKTLDLYASDIASYGVTVKDGKIYVDPTPVKP